MIVKFDKALFFPAGPEPPLSVTPKYFVLTPSEARQMIYAILAAFWRRRVSTGGDRNSMVPIGDLKGRS